jgi:DNA-binding NarL/FixJ family response regulator
MIFGMRTRVLVVDDDSAFRVLAIQLLERAGLHVAGEADTARRAFEAVLSLRPAAVLLDVGLPDGDGITLAHTLSALPWRPRVVLTSSDADAAGPEAVRDCGAAAFIAKLDLTDVALRNVFEPAPASGS